MVMDAIPTLAGYELQRELGGGSLTHVFAARHLNGEFNCAIKMLRPAWANDRVASQLISREARVGLAVRQRHLIRILDAQVTHSPHYIVMQHLDGETLRDCLNRHGKFDIKTALYVARDIVGAIDAIHAAGFVHSDIKPANIWLGWNGEAVLMDLGFAHRPGEHANLMRDGYLFGTPEYLAPELCDGATNHTFASDWFSFGLVLLEMLTGETPYARGDIDFVLHNHQHMDIRYWVKSRTTSWPRRLGELIECLTAKEPADRPLGRFIVDAINEVVSALQNEQIANRGQLAVLVNVAS